VEYSSSLTLEFYQVMVGSTTMTLHGWRQLAEWSLDYSCLGPEDIKRGRAIFARKWELFCDAIVREYGEYADSLEVEVPEA
jgi:adenosine deaminase CECR1